MRLRIVEFPDPVLRKPTKPVTDFGPSLKTFVDEMTIAMKDDDGVGIAAPQVGVSKKIAVVCIEGTRYVLVNPRIVEMEGEQGGEEGCLSFPGIFGEIKRAARVVVECQDETGAPRRYEGEGFVARAFQHEIEHLDGKLLIDHFSPIKREMIRKKLLKSRS
ncbi:MAG: peptide deformylase [Pyramidobacter sp.]|nr:peptide deformylase [Pyramidobacter sp.]